MKHLFLDCTVTYRTCKLPVKLGLGLFLINLEKNFVYCGSWHFFHINSKCFPGFRHFVNDMLIFLFYVLRLTALVASQGKKHLFYVNIFLNTFL